MGGFLGGEAVEAAPRKAADEAAEASKIGSRTAWAALGAVLAALGPLLALLWAVLALPGNPGRLRERAPAGHFGAFFGGPAQEVRNNSFFL